MNETLLLRFLEKYRGTQTKLVRDELDMINWSNRLIGIKGSRGVGKTTLILQYIKKNFNPDNKVLYVSLDHIYFANHLVYDLAEEFRKKGGKVLALDEVHRYPNWSQEIKNIYDDFPDLQVIFTGSSLLQLSKAKADLSRRAVMYNLPELSFRNYLKFANVIDIPMIAFDDILFNHTEIALDISKEIKPLVHFSNYLKHGYYPFFLENIPSYHQKLQEIVLTVLETDITQYEQVKTSNIIYLKKLLDIISRSTPFKPNISNISQRTGISINTTKDYIRYLEKANLISLLYNQPTGINSINKPEKLFLSNPNLMYVLAEESTNTGNLRESFFLSQIKHNFKVHSPGKGDFIIDEKYIVEVGGRNKSGTQISDLENAFIAADDIETGVGKKIPLWLFGFIY